MRRDLFLTTVITGGLLGACSTTPVATSVDLKRKSLTSGAYLQYALPQTVLVATISEIKDEGGGGGAKDVKSAAAPTIVNNVYAAAPAKAEAKPDPKAATVAANPDAKAGKKAGKAIAEAAPAAAVPKPEEDAPKLPVDCDTQRNQYLNLRGANTESIKNEGLFLNKLRALIKSEQDLSKPPFIWSDDVPEADRLVARVNAERGLAKMRDAVAGKLAASYSMECAKPLKIEVTTEIAADTKRIYALVIKDDVNSADKLAAKPDENGLLTSMTTTADEKSGEIGVAVVKSLVSFAYLVEPTAIVPTAALTAVVPAAIGGGSAARANAGQLFTRGAKPPPPPPPPKPTKVSAAPYLKFIQEAEVLEPIRPYPGLPRSYPKPPVGPLRFTLEELFTKKTVLKTFAIEVSCPSTVGRQDKSDIESEGVMVSALVSCKLTTELTPGDGPSDSLPDPRTSYFSAWDARYPIALPLNRTALVSRTTTYAFNQGRQTSVEYDKPSDGLAAAALPGTIIFGAISGLSNAIQGRTGISKDETDRIKARANLYDAQAGLYDSQVKAMTAKSALESKATEPQ